MLLDLGPPALSVKFPTGHSSLSLSIYLFIFLSGLLFHLDAVCVFNTVEVHMWLLLVTFNIKI